MQQTIPLSPRCKMLCCSDKGQATLEAAFLLPVAFLMMALLIQPLCLAYTNVVMQEAAGLTLRATATATASSGVKTEEIMAFCKRRLAAIPEVSLFHVGGENDWNISLSGGGDSKTARVEITGHARPFPVFGVLAQVFSESDEHGIVLRVSIEQRIRSEWLEGGYSAWETLWGHP